MAYIACDKHGGQLASLISRKLHQLIESKCNSTVGIKIIKYESLGGEQFRMFVDSDTLQTLSVAHNIDLAKTISDEEKLFEITLDFVAICPACLNDWLAKRSNVAEDIN